jgi:hypothetical protein
VKQETFQIHTNCERPAATPYFPQQSLEGTQYLALSLEHSATYLQEFTLYREREKRRYPCSAAQFAQIVQTTNAVQDLWIGPKKGSDPSTWIYLVDIPSNLPLS